MTSRGYVAVCKKINLAHPYGGQYLVCLFWATVETRRHNMLDSVEKDLSLEKDSLCR